MCIEDLIIKLFDSFVDFLHFKGYGQTCQHWSWTSTVEIEVSLSYFCNFFKFRQKLTDASVWAYVFYLGEAKETRVINSI